MDYISENNLIDFLGHEGKEYLDARRTTGRLAAAPGNEIYYELYRTKAEDIPADASLPSAPRGLLVLCHGFTETCTKYHELIYYFLRRGFCVLAYDHRGHGRSFRQVKNPYKVHANDFDADYVGDLDLLVQNVARRKFPDLPLFLYGHSMGGCVAARYMELHPGVFSRCILSSPMFGIKAGGVPNFLALFLSWFMKSVGQGERYTLGQHDFLPDETFEVSAATGRARFERYNELRKNTPDFQLSGGSYCWLYTALRAAARAVSPKETAKIKAPVLLFEAEDDAYVPRARIAKFRKNLPGLRYHAFRGTKHEIYNSGDAVIKAYYKEIFRFLSETDKTR